MRLFPIENTLDTDDWYTPSWVFDGLDIEFDLDVAAPDGGAPHVPAHKFYTVAQDGLAQPWEGRVWCNPRPTAWCRRWAEHGNGCLLIRADLSTSGPYAAFGAADAMWVPPKRLQFDHHGEHKSGAVNFSTVMLAAGKTCVAALSRLETKYGGCSRTLVPANG